MKHEFILYKNNYGFGWNIKDVRKEPQRRIFHTSNKEQATSIYRLLVETSNLELIPAHPYSVWIPQVLIIREKDSNSYFLLKDELQTKKIMAKYLANMLEGGLLKPLETDGRKHVKETNMYIDALAKKLKEGSYSNMLTFFKFFVSDFEIKNFNNIK